MSKFGKLPSKTYNIYHFNFTKLLEYGKRDKENLILEVNKEYSKLSYKVVNNNALYEGYDKKGNCQLFDQTLKILNVEDKEDIFEHIYVIIDFKDYINSKNGKKEFVKTLRQFENGIKLYIKDKEIHIVDFLKSNTMSKACCVLYINKEFADNTNIINRATFGLDKKQYILSKWYAYSGLSLSDATILHNIKFKADELVVIPDDEKERNVECITAISVDLLQELIDIYRKRISDIKGTTPYKEKLNYKKALEVVAKDNTKYDDFKIFASNFSKMQKVYEKLMCYRNSKDYERLSETIDSQYSEYIKKIVYTLNKAVEIIDSDDTFDIVYEKLGVLIKEVNNPEHHEVYWENFHVVNFPITINKFDGEGLITLDLARQINNELNQFNEKKLPYGYTFQIRLPFIKGIVNSCNIKEFCKEKGITKIYGLSYDENKYKEYDISNVKMILTESQFKCAKLLKNCGMSIDKFMELLNEYDYSLGINHLEYSHDSKVDLNYQVCSTLPFNQQELDYLIEFNDRQYKEETSSEKLIAACIERYKSDLENEMVNRPEYYDFYMSTQRYKDFRRTTIESLKSKYLSLKFKQNGERRFLCSDCLELLYHAFYHQSINAFKDYMNLSEIYAPKNKLVANEKCFILRNPHYSRNEIGIMKNSTQDGSERKKYFGHLSGVIMFNPLSLLADRLGGADFDGDSVIIVNAMFARKAIRKLENKEKGNSLIYPVVNIPGLDSQPVEFNYVNKVHSLYNTFNSRVGLISNAALSESFSVYKEDFNKHDRIALYTIINGLEIDSAKKGIKPMLIKSVKPKLAKEFLRIKDEELKRNKGLSKYSIKFIADNANEHSIYYLMHKSLSYEPSKENVSRKSITRGYKYDINKIDPIKLQEVIETYCIYTRFNELLGSKRKYQIAIDRINEHDYLCNKIFEIVNKNYPEYDLEKVVELITNVRDNVEDIKEVLNKYCFEQKNKFHYMRTLEEKKDYVLNELNIDLSIDDLTVLSNFSNDGYMLLYLILNYLYNIHCQEEIKYKKQPKLTEYIEFINKKVISEFKVKTNISESMIENIARNVKTKFEEILNNLENASISHVREQLYNDLVEKVKDVSLDHLLIFVDLNKSEMVFDIMSKQTKEFLDNHRGETKNEE